MTQDSPNMTLAKSKAEKMQIPDETEPFMNDSIKSKRKSMNQSQDEIPEEIDQSCQSPLQMKS